MFEVVTSDVLNNPSSSLTVTDSLRVALISMVNSNWSPDASFIVLAIFARPFASTVSVYSPDGKPSKIKSPAGLLTVRIDCSGVALLTKISSAPTITAV